LARVRDGFGRRRFAAESGLICARNVTEGSRSLFLFFVDAVRLCIACVATLCASDVVHSSVLQFFCVLQSVQIAVEWLRQGFSKGTCSPVLACDSEGLLQVPVEIVL
jgi:hypothetical protein